MRQPRWSGRRREERRSRAAERDHVKKKAPAPCTRRSRGRHYPAAKLGGFHGSPNLRTAVNGHRCSEHDNGGKPSAASSRPLVEAARPMAALVLSNGRVTRCLTEHAGSKITGRAGDCALRHSFQPYGTKVLERTRRGGTAVARWSLRVPRFVWLHDITRSTPRNARTVQRERRRRCDERRSLTRADSSEGRFA